LLHAGVGLVYTVYEVAIAAIFTVPAAAAEEADANPLTNCPTLHG
jgi:hypothetical protein